MIRQSGGFDGVNDEVKSDTALNKLPKDCPKTSQQLPKMVVKMIRRSKYPTESGNVFEIAICDLRNKVPSLGFGNRNFQILWVGTTSLLRDDGVCEIQLFFLVNR